jgi:glycosyltransferase involved in cell wall biosynthesis
LNELKYTEFIGQIKAHLENHIWKDRYLFTGLVQDNQLLADYFRAADIFAFPSNNEGLGNVVLEAMACELPVIASQLPVLENVVIDGKNGIFIPKGNIEALKDGMIRLIDNPSLARLLAKNARNYVQDNHSLLNWQYDLAVLYRDMMDQKPV